MGAELELETVLGGALGGEHHARVVDEQVDPRVGSLEFLGRRADVVERRQIQRLQRDVRIRGRRGDSGDGVLALVEVAHREDDVRALACQPHRGVVADAGVGPRDDGNAAGLVWNVVGRPLGGGHGVTLLGPV